MKKTRIIKSGFRTMSRHKIRTFFMMIGVVVGITTLTLIFSLGKSTEKKIMDNIKKMFSASNILVNAGGGRMMGKPNMETITKTLTLEDLEYLQSQIPNILSYDPMLMIDKREVIYREKSFNARILGQSPAAETIWNRPAIQGSFITDEHMHQSSRVAMLGVVVAKELFGDINPINKKIRIGNVPFIVIGVLDEVGADPHGMNKDQEIIIPITTMMKRMMNVNFIMFAKIEVKNLNQMAETVDQIRSILRSRHHLNENEPDDFSMITPIQVQEMIATANRVFNVFLPLIAGVALLVGGVVISNLMLITVNERRSEIGLRKAVGARSKDILYQFVLESTAITITGGIVGILIGTFSVQALAWMMKLPPTISWKAVSLGILFSAIVGLSAGIFPARRAAGFDPVETLR
jgi:putative ABC transport system permease protein